MTKILRIAVLVLAVIVVVQFVISLIKDKQQLQRVVATLEQENSDITAELSQLSADILAANKRVELYEAEKIELENKSIELQRELKNAIKNEECANVTIPTAAANQLYERASKIRQQNSTK